MKVTTLTPVERLTLANQFRLLAISDPDQAESYENRIEILESGYTGEYNLLFQNFSDEGDPELSSELHGILTMYRYIDNAIARLTDQEKEQLNLDSIAFEGFDQNTDEHFGLMEFWVNHLNLYAEHREKYLNSHSQFSLEQYRAMLPVYEDLIGNNVRDFTAADLQRFIDRVGH
jgi:uncharacterized protein YfbU (UPF0304 family)